MLCLVSLSLLAPAKAQQRQAGGDPAAAVASRAPAQPPSPRYEDDQVEARVVMRTPDQLRAFYIAREFNPASIDKILATCFITPVIHNKRFEYLWVDLDAWRFTQGDRAIPRIKRDYWPDKWREAGLPQAQQSTFGWTLMPEVRDLRLDEGVGGSVVLPAQSGPFTLTMNFPTGADRRGPVKTIVFENIQCTGK
ncbi:MAG: hypothetical protein PVJ83_08770 [Gammaproteobacteria bacterium]